MRDRACHKELRLREFTVFQDARFAFSPGVNALVGENGTGKTHLMKVLYAVQYAAMRGEASVRKALGGVFQVTDTAQLKRLGFTKASHAEAEGQFGDWRWQFVADHDARLRSVAGGAPRTERPVFIPATDMMGHTRGFVTTYDEYDIDFDQTHRDIVSLLLGPERRRPQNGQSGAVEALREVLGGDLVLEGERFHLDLQDGRLPMTLVAEGIRKVATLLRLARSGWLEPGATLFWDEPEVNLNPVVMRTLVAAILAVARSGVQVFLATHSYTILREIDVQARRADQFRFFALAVGQQGVTVQTADSYLGIEPNPIERHYADLYVRGIRKQLAHGGDLE